MRETRQRKWCQGIEPSPQAHEARKEEEVCLDNPATLPAALGVAGLEGKLPLLGGDEIAHDVVVRAGDAVGAIHDEDDGHVRVVHGHQALRFMFHCSSTQRQQQRSSSGAKQQRRRAINGERREPKGQKKGTRGEITTGKNVVTLRTGNIEKTKKHARKGGRRARDKQKRGGRV